MSDVERMERLMNQTKYARKSIIKIFGKNLEEFRREMHYSKEIINSDLLAQNIPDSMIKHAENVNIKSNAKDPFNQAFKANLNGMDSFDDGEIRTSNLSANKANITKPMQQNIHKQKGS